MISHLFKTFVIITLIAGASGCRITAIATTGGSIYSSQHPTCTGPALCELGITDPAYSDVFVATPGPGYRFVKWYGGDGFLCSDSTDPQCVVDLEGGVLGNAIVASNETSYLMPIFREVTITDTVEADGKIWAQPTLFWPVTFDDLIAACPAGVCGSGAMLNGYDMTGWTWASVEDINSLFNYYIGAALLGPGPSSVTTSDGAWEAAIFDDSWFTPPLPPGGEYARGLFGVMYNPDYLETNTCIIGNWLEHSLEHVSEPGGGTATTNISGPCFGTSFTGAWFYQTP